MSRALTFKALTMYGVGALLLVAVASWALLDVNRYYDFAPATCDAAGNNITARLAGEWSKTTRTMKGSPYTLVVVAMPETAIVDSIQVASSEFPHGKPVKVVYVGPESGPQSMGFVTEPIEILYEDVSVTGQVRARSDSPPQQFRCEMKRNYHEEIRIRFMSNLMSV